MRLVVATPLYPPEIGGPATYAKILEEGLPARGIEVGLVKFGEVRHLPKIISHYAYYRRVLEAARGADAVYALDPVSTGLPAMLAAKRAGKPFVVKIVGDYAWEQGQQRFGVTASLDEFVKERHVPLRVLFLRRIQKCVASHAVRVVVPSEYLKGVIAAWGIPREKMDVVYNAVPLGEVGSVPEPVVALHRPLVVTAGRLVPWKHIDKIIDALVGVPRASLVVVGDGPLHEALVRHADDVLPGRVLFTGILSHEDTLAVIKSADVFVLNSSYEGLSHLLIEAQMLGVPTVATRCGGNAEVITDDENGLIVTVGDTESVAHSITRLLDDESLRARLSLHTIDSAKRFSTGSMLSAVSAILKAT